MRPQRSCINCRRRKQKCDLIEPCSRCIKLGVECHFVEHKEKEVIVKRPKIKKKDIIRLENKFNKIEKLAEEYNIGCIMRSNSSETLSTPENLPDTPEDNKFIHLDKQMYYPMRDMSKEQHLLDVFFVYHHTTFPYLSEERVRKIKNLGDERDTALIFAICSLALKTYNFLLDLETVSIDDNPYYKRTKKLLSSNLKPSLSLVQATLISHTLETGNAHPFKSSYLSAEAIRMGQILNLHTLNLNQEPAKISDSEKERIKTWIQCLNVDQLSSLFCGKPAYNRLQDLISTDADLVYKFCHSKQRFMLNRPEREYIICQIFYHMVRIKAKLFKLNSLLMERTYDYDTMVNGLSEIIKRINEINIIDKVTNPHFNTTKIDENYGANFHYFSRFSLFAFKHTLSIVSHYLLYQLLETGNDTDALTSIMHHSLAKSEGMQLIQRIKAAEVRYEQLLSNDKGKVVYAAHFCPSLGIEWAILPHLTEQNSCSKKFVNMCFDIFKNYGKFWPTIENMTCRKRISNLNPI